MPPKLTFIGTLPQNASTRERELQIAEARKHAATISHSRRKGMTAGSRHPTGSKALRCQPAPSRRQAFTRHGPGRFQKCEGNLVADPNITQDLRRTLQKERPRDEKRKAVNTVSELLQILWNKDLSKLAMPSYQMDPFYRIPHGNSTSFYEALDFFTHTILPNNAPVYTLFNVSNIFTTNTFELASRDYFFHTWTATMHLIRSLFAPQSTSAQNALRHQGAALAQLQRAVNLSVVSVDDYTICCVLMVALLARLYGNEQSHAVHCHYLQKMVEQRGGLNDLVFDGFTRCAILQWESFWALDNGKSVFEGLRQLKCPIYPSLPLSNGLQAEVCHLPVGFRQLAYQGKLAVDVLELLGRIANHDRLRPASPIDEAQWTRRKYDDFWEACRCLADPRPGLEKFLCLALLLFCVDEYSPRRLFRRGMTLFGGPRALLSRELPKFGCQDATEIECLMWIWMVVVDAWSSDCAKEGDLPPNGQRLLADFRRVFTIAASWEVTKSIVSKFFWSERFSSACETFWGYSNE